MNIGIDGRAASIYNGTGIGTYTYELLKSLNLCDDFNRYVICMNSNDKIDIDFKNNFNISKLKLPVEKNFWDTVSHSTGISNKGLDLYHIPQNGIGMDIPKKCPSVITLHDIIPAKMPETVSAKYLKIFFQNIELILKNSDSIITVSQFSKSDIVSVFNYPEDKIFVTPLASQNIFKPVDTDYAKAFLKKHYGIDKNYLLNVGGFSPRKNIIGLIDAFSIISKIYKDLILIIVGTRGKSYSIYKEHVHKLGLESRVIFPGFIKTENLNYFYNGASAFIYPSFYEGFGLPPIEAMACGTPVICSNATSLPETVGNAALLIDPNNEHDIADAISDVLENKLLREHLIFEGFVQNNRLTWTSTAQKTISAYEAIIKNS